MQLRQAQRSRFTAPIEMALREQLEALNQGQLVHVHLAATRDGYGGSVRVTLPATSAQEFETDWQGTDSTRFPARLRAAVTALATLGLSGQYQLNHTAGVLTVQKQI
ncbi:hypothetical protein [Deinococcus cavernae]|uniref:hypothetical protein n=1 Tax=Deinococcus cavernae TaxID=2320857 RepID=UPI0011C24177|nr:hypothetical protein [Deinococcus cavernae]